MKSYWTPIVASWFQKPVVLQEMSYLHLTASTRGVVKHCLGWQASLSCMWHIWIHTGKYNQGMLTNVTLWWTNILLWKDPPFLMGNSTISMAIFHCYVSSPEGNLSKNIGFTWVYMGFTWVLHGFYYSLIKILQSIPHVSPMFVPWNRCFFLPRPPEARFRKATLQAPASGAPAELRRMAQELMEMAERLEAMEPWDGWSKWSEASRPEKPKQKLYLGVEITN